MDPQLEQDRTLALEGDSFDDQGRPLLTCGADDPRLDGPVPDVRPPDAVRRCDTAQRELTANEFPAG